MRKVKRLSKSQILYEEYLKRVQEGTDLWQNAVAILEGASGKAEQAKGLKMKEVMKNLHEGVKESSEKYNQKKLKITYAYESNKKKQKL